MKRIMINDALRLARLYWGYSQSELAIELGISQSMISEIERGAKNVSMELLEKYSQGLGVRMSQLLLFAEELEGEPVRKRGKLLIASKALKVLEAFAPRDTSLETC
jgi:transcriptional regulator with XRE-family HTH domain